ncbi:MAG TPA: hypothetical protein VGH30_09700 [Jatrophihabitantaceae bacterium]|jgi:NADH:ubiquinone oxidoreductase subunit 5 (subunit L)/multisubunit Na+/H+ antiporter MnhA subunit
MTLIGVGVATTPSKRRLAFSNTAQLGLVTLLAGAAAAGTTWGRS